MKNKEIIKTKLNQLEKQFSELAKDVVDLNKNVSELRQTLEKDVEVVEEEVKSELVVGKWYKHYKFGKMMFCFSGKFGNSDETNSNYGFNFNGIYKEKLGVHKHEMHIKATPQEVEIALVSEAKKRGFLYEVEFNEIEDVKNGGIGNNSGKVGSYFDFEDGKLYTYGHGKWCIFKDGIWSEIKETIKEEVIDWDVPQLLRTECGKVVLSNGKHNSFSFVGNVVVSTLKSQPVGYFAKNWTKIAFKPTKLTIEQSL